MGTFLKTLNNNKMSPEDFILSTTGYYTHIVYQVINAQTRRNRFIIIYLKNKNRYQRCIILFTITHTHTHT